MTGERAQPITARVQRVVEDAASSPKVSHDERALGVRRAATAALRAMDQLAVLADEGDPRYPRWWASLEHAARELAHQAGLVKHGLKAANRLDSRTAPEVWQAAEAQSATLEGRKPRV